METGFLKVPPSSSFFASPPELSRSVDSFPTPTPSASRTSTEPLSATRMPSDGIASIDKGKAPVHTLLSPPESPDMTSRRRPSPPDGDTIMSEEPLLSLEEPSIGLDTPLFDLSDKNEPLVKKALESIVQSRQAQKTTPLPQPKEYAHFVSAAWRMCQQAPRSWYRQERRYDHLYAPAVAGVQKKQQPTSGFKRPIPATRVRKQGTDAQNGARPVRRPRATPKARAMDGFDGFYPSPASTADFTSPSRPKAVGGREDNDWQSLPDMTPPLTSLPNGTCLKVDWKGGPLPIESYDNFDVLHEAEQKLAAKLRLTPNAYLTSKRRIFIENVRKYRQGALFRKTDAQKACKIDVNKASKLWEAFDKVGWFRDEVIEDCARQAV